MEIYIKRYISNVIKKRLKNNPAVAILGPRQCGKSTLAKKIMQDFSNSIYLDMEKLSDLRKIDDPELFFNAHKDEFVCFDEIQQKPEIFRALRSIIDERAENCMFLILGSASIDLLKQSAETLAGRISYIELTPLYYNEIIDYTNKNDFWKLWLRGGFPRSFLAEDEEESLNWRKNFIKTFLERDIPQLGFNIPPKKLQRFWMMIAHVHGQIFNGAKIGSALGVSAHTVRNYLDILEQTYVLRVLLPYEKNIKKRLIKSPKVYIRDTGLLHALLDIGNKEDLFGNPIFGVSWEGFVIENLISHFTDFKFYFYRSAGGAEIDLIMEKGNQIIPIECKASASPTVSKGFWITLKDLGIKKAWVIAPVNESYQIKENIMVANLNYFIENVLK